MKGITISDRYKEKDAYDIYALIANYKDGTASCFEEIKPFCKKGLVAEGIKSICEKFETEGSVGPVWAAKFMEPDNANAARLKQTVVFRQVLPFVENMKKVLGGV